MQRLLIRIPAPTAVLADRDIVKRVERERLHSAVAFSVPTVFDIPVPQMKQPSANGADTAHDARGIRTSPRQIMPPPPIIHQRSAGAIVPFSKRCAEDCTISG